MQWRFGGKEVTGCVLLPGETDRCLGGCIWAVREMKDRNNQGFCFSNGRMELPLSEMREGVVGIDGGLRHGSLPVKGSL